MVCAFYLLALAGASFVDKIGTPEALNIAAIMHVGIGLIDAVQVLTFTLQDVLFALDLHVLEVAEERENHAELSDL